MLHRPAEQGEERPAQADGDDNRRSARPRTERFETRLRHLDLALSLLHTFFLCMYLNVITCFDIVFLHAWHLRNLV